MTAQLTIARAGGRSVVARARPGGPLRLLTPRAGGDAAWVYQASLGGGLVGADDTALAIEVEAGAALFLGTQASGKVYRAARSRTAIDARVAPGGLLIAWPDPIACFAGAALDQRQTFALQGDASLVVVDAITAGRVARGERWAFAQLATRLHVTVDDAPVVRDATVLTPAHGPLAPRLIGDAIATIVAVGPRATPIARALADATTAGPPIVAASAHPWGAIARIVAPTIGELTSVIARHLRAPVAALLGDDPWARRW